MKNLILFFLMILISGCLYKDDENASGLSKNKTKKPTQSDSSAQIKNPEDKVYEGLYILNANENIFRDCMNPDSTYWVTDGSGKIEGMYNKFISSKNVYGAVVVKLKGKITETKNKRYLEKYPRTFEVMEVVDMQKKNFSNTCIPYDFWGLGNEPGWSLQISENENLIEFTDYGENKTYSFFYEEPKSEDGKIIYNAHNNIQRNYIDISIKKENCSDNMSDKVYEFSAEVKINKNKKYNGCCIKGKSADGF